MRNALLTVVAFVVVTGCGMVPAQETPQRKQEEEKKAKGAPQLAAQEVSALYAPDIQGVGRKNEGKPFLIVGVAKQVTQGLSVPGKESAMREVFMDGVRGGPNIYIQFVSIPGMEKLKAGSRVRVHCVGAGASDHAAFAATKVEFLD